MLLPDDVPHAGTATFRARNVLANVLDQDVAAPIAAFITSGTGIVQIRTAGGPVNDVSVDATAYAHRHQQYSLAALTPNPSAPLDTAWGPIGDRTDGSYNAFDSRPTPAALRSAYPEKTLARLRHLAQRWDREQIFSEPLMPR